MRPILLKLKNYYSPYGIDTPCPLFTWQLESQLRNQLQAFYRIIVAHTEQELELGEGTLWDSGRVASSEQLGVPYSGYPL